MGLNNSKPSDVSDAAWMQYQDKKLTMLQNQINENNQLNEEYNKTFSNLGNHYLEYCKACHDVPKYLMVFPSYREECNKARTQLFSDGINLIEKSGLIYIKEEIFKKINNM